MNVSGTDKGKHHWYSFTNGLTPLLRDSATIDIITINNITKIFLISLNIFSFII